MSTSSPNKIQLVNGNQVDLSTAIVEFSKNPESIAKPTEEAAGKTRLELIPFGSGCIATAKYKELGNVIEVRGYMDGEFTDEQLGDFIELTKKPSDEELYEGFDDFFLKNVFKKYRSLSTTRSLVDATKKVLIAATKTRFRWSNRDIKAAFNFLLSKNLSCLDAMLELKWLFDGDFPDDPIDFYKKVVSVLWPLSLLFANILACEENFKLVRPVFKFIALSIPAIVALRDQEDLINNQKILSGMKGELEGDWIEFTPFKAYERCLERHALSQDPSSAVSYGYALQDLAKRSNIIGDPLAVKSFLKMLNGGCIISDWDYPMTKLNVLKFVKSDEFWWVSGEEASAIMSERADDRLE